MVEYEATSASHQMSDTRSCFQLANTEQDTKYVCHMIQVANKRLL